MSSTKPTPPAAHRPAPPFTVLLVDDTPASLGLVNEALRAEGLRCLVADSAAAARRVLEKHRPELILLDIVMPGEDGLSLCAWLKSSPDFARIPVLFLTSLDEPAQKIAAFAAGALDYVTKPVHVPELLARVRVQLQLAEQRGQLEQRNRELEAELALRLDAEAQLASSLDQAVLLLAFDGAPLFATRLAHTLVSRHLGGDFSRLPVGGGRLETASGVLLVRCFEGGDAAGRRLYTLDEEQAPPGPARLLRLGLTPRQAEVAYWVAQGKSNPEVAVILGASPRTIDKHMERILCQLGLENRGSLMFNLASELRA